MKYSYFPGWTLRNKAKDLDDYARACAEKLGFSLEELTGNAAGCVSSWC